MIENFLVEFLGDEITHLFIILLGLFGTTKIMGWFFAFLKKTFN